MQLIVLPLPRLLRKKVFATEVLKFRPRVTIFSSVSHDNKPLPGCSAIVSLSRRQSEIQYAVDIVAGCA